jgi:catechol 2,3-dioxygenase-like lactoylglutathione lyase family enzyme
MKRFHVHAHVTDLAASIAFYNRLFAAEPTRVEADYAKWMLDDPRINFAISTRGGKPGIDHLGFQTDSTEELAELKTRAQAADIALLDEGATTCCYAASEKHWITDPQGIAWEHFHTLGNIPVFSQNSAQAPIQVPGQASACCAPAAAEAVVAAPAPAAASSCCAPQPAATATATPAAGCAPRGKPIGIAVKAANPSSCC